MISEIPSRTFFIFSCFGHGKKGKVRSTKNPNSSESRLDTLIDSICLQTASSHMPLDYTYAFDPLLQALSFLLFNF